MSYLVDLTQSIGAKGLNALRFGVHSDIGKMEIGKPILHAVKDHYMALNGERHHSWATGPGFYAKAAKATTMKPYEEGVEIITDKPGLSLRIEGGVVTPGKNPSCKTGNPTQYLTIPAIAEAYGRSACSINNLVFVRFGNNPDSPAALMESGPKSATDATTGKKIRNKLKQGGTQGAFARRVWFWLVKSTTHKPDPSVLPDLDMLEEVGNKALEDYAAKFLSD